MTPGSPVVGCGDDGPSGSGPSADSGPETSLDGALWPEGGIDATTDAFVDGSVDANADAQKDAEAEPPPGNAVLLASGAVVPIYPVSDPTASTRAVGFSFGTTLDAIDEHGAVLWSVDAGVGALFGGFDFDADGWPDVGLVRSKDSGQSCGGQPMLDTFIDVVSGRTGTQRSLVPAMAAKCWSFPTATYPTEQWTGLGVLFGAGTSAMALAPYYATDGTFTKYGAGGFSTLGQFSYPSTAAYDATYLNDKPNAWGMGQSFLANSHVANGLVAVRQGQPHVVFFTSGRVVDYVVGPLGSDQLVRDTPFLTGNRTDLAGRNYGLVALDPGSPDLLVLLAGTSADTVFSDLATGKMAADPWGQIERHLTLYDIESGALDDRFFSYAHDNNDGNQYEGRIVYPNGPFVRMASGPSRLAFTVYSGGHWELHVTAPGSTVDAVVMKDVFLWDISDIDQDGSDEWLLSQVRDPSEPDVPGYYFPKWRTRIAHWDEAQAQVVSDAEHDGFVPLLQGTFRQPARSTSRGSLYPALTVRTAVGLTLLTRDPTGAIGQLPL